MATIKQTDGGQIVQHPYGYYYTADDFGNPCCGAYLDLADAETALEMAGQTDGFPDADFAIDDRGDPTDADDRFARVQWDEENGAEDFADALREILQSSEVEHDDQIWRLADVGGPLTRAIWLPVETARRFEEECRVLTGWEGGPEFAPHPLLFYYPAKSGTEAA